jgi:Transposase DDE domain.
MNYPEFVKNHLLQDIRDMAADPARFVMNPESDFSRHRKMGMEQLLHFLISMEKSSTSYELLKFFDFDHSLILSNSAFYQQRQKLRLEAFSHLLEQFNSHFEPIRYKGFQLMACDGSQFNIARNPNDPTTFQPADGKTTKGFNSIHVVALFDLLSKKYRDVVIQPGKEKNEYRAICDLADRFPVGDDKVLFIGDRGFGSYNFYAHAKENGLFFLVRVKDLNSERLLRENIPLLQSVTTSVDQLNNPTELDIRGTFNKTSHSDLTIQRIITRSYSKKNRKYPELAEQYRVINKSGTFDFIEHGSGDEYPLTLRFLRFEIADGVFENVVTNLPDSFDVEEIKWLYNLRWGIETSFRDLKHSIGATDFISKKVEYISQEIWSRLILYNFCSEIVNHVILTTKSRKHQYQVNFCLAINICRQFLRCRVTKAPPDIESLIGSYLLPIRPDRNFNRIKRFRNPMSFCYR